MFNFIFTADKASKKPLYEQLYSYVADEIKNKNIKENERMPSKKSTGEISRNKRKILLKQHIQFWYRRGI